MKFLKVTVQHNKEIVYVHMDAIECISRNLGEKGKTIISLHGENNCYNVDETVDDIMQQVKRLDLHHG